MCEYVKTRVLRLLEAHEELTVDEMVANSNMKRGTIIRVMSSLHTGKQVFIADWKPTGTGHDVAIWSLGDEVDAPKPAQDPRKRIDPILGILAGLAAVELSPFRTAMWNVERAR